MKQDFQQNVEHFAIFRGFEAQDPQNRVQEAFLIWNPPFDSNFREDFENQYLFNMFEQFNHQNRLRNQILCILMCLISFLKILKKL